MNNKILKILGFGEWLDYAFITASNLVYWEEILTIRLNKINSYTYDLSSFIEPEPNCQYFLALDGSAFGTVREKHLSDLISRGFDFISLIPESSNKNINSINCLVSSGVNINTESVKIQFNTFIGPNSIISSGFSAGRSVTIDPGTIVLDGVRIGKNVTLQNVAKVFSSVNIGEYSLIQTLKEIKQNLKGNMMYSETFDGVVSIKK
jgi:acetyltransferase-like isoleucine patch superfamily enzyme